jgi:hypothetical protein
MGGLLSKKAIIIDFEYQLFHSKTIKILILLITKKLKICSGEIKEV